MFIIRSLLGRIILILNFIFAPKKRNRATHEQIKIDLQTKSLQLYQDIPMIPQGALSGLSSETRIRHGMKIMVAPLSNAVTQYWFPS